MSLFRPEVQQAQSAQWLGVVRLSRPAGFTAIVLMSMAIAGLLIAFSAWGGVNRKSKVSGLLVPEGGALNIVAPVAGVLGDLQITEGSTVLAASVLVTIDTERHGNIGNIADAAGGGKPVASNPSLLAAQQIALRQQSLSQERIMRQLQARQREQALSDRIHTIAAQSRQAVEEIASQTSRVALAKKSLERNAQLAQDGFVSASSLQAKEEELIDVTARLQGMERSRLALQ